MLIPIVGELCTAIGLILCTYFENTPMEVAGVTEALFPGLAGNNFEFFLKSLKQDYHFFFSYRWLVYYVNGCI